MGFIIRQAPFFMILFSLQKMDRILLHECLSTPSPNPIPAPSQPPSPFPELLQHWGFQTTTSSYVIGWTNLLGLETSEFWVDIRAQGDMGSGGCSGSLLFHDGSHTMEVHCDNSGQ